MQGRAPGWYPDERYPEDERWWDGTAWSAGTRPAGDPAVTARSAAEVAEEASMQRIRGWALLLVPVGVALAYAIRALVARS